MIQLRDYQTRAVSATRNAYASGATAPLLVLPTGGGKTIIFSYIAFSSVQRGKKVLILVHRIELLRQTQSKLQAFGLRVGLISPKYTPDYGAPVQVAMVQTMVKRLGKYPEFDLIVTDECHHVSATTYMSVIGNYSKAYQLGVTATPIRSDGKGLGKGHGGIFDTMVLGPSTRELMDMGFLVEPEIYIPPTELDMRGVKRSMGDFNKKETAARVDKRGITGNALDHYHQLSWQDPAVVFCVNVDHAKHVAQEARDMGLRAYSVDGSMEDRDRNRILSGLGDGSVHMVTSCDVISEGTDIPAIACGISLRPTQSTGLHLQQIGRCLRPSPGKSKAIWLDHVGNCAQIINGDMTVVHGFPDDDREWSLEGLVKAKRETEKVERITLCVSCYLAFKPTLAECPHCGAPRKVKPRPEIKVSAGELVKLDKTTKLAAQKKRNAETGKARTLEDLEALAEARGYKKGWAKHIFESRQRSGA